MTRLPRQTIDDGWIHVMNRGARRLPIFGDEGDRVAFLRRVGDGGSAHGLEVHAYALMANHFHILVRGTVGALSRTMQHICGGYTQRFNAKYGLDGALLRGRYRSKPVDSDRYLHEVVRYIHRNPIQHGDGLDLSAFEWTSHLAYLDQAAAPKWLTTGVVLERFGCNRTAYRQFVEGPHHGDGRSASREGAGLIAAPRLADPSDIERALGVNSPAERELIRRGGRGVRNDLRSACALLCAELTPATANGIAARYGFRSGSSVRSAVGNARRLYDSEPSFRAFIDRARHVVAAGLRTGV